MSGITPGWSYLAPFLSSETLQALGTLEMTRVSLVLARPVEDKHAIGIRGLVPDPTWD